MDIRRADLPLLISLDVLLEELNVTRAARRLKLSQPALSAQLGRLRELFKDPLLVPSEAGRGMTPTPRALELQPALHQALLDLQSAVVSRVEFNPQEAQRHFTIALNDNIFTIIGLSVAQDVLALGGPGIRLSFVAPAEENLTYRMERGEIDLYVGISARIPEALKSRRLLTDEFCFAQRKEHPRGQGAPTLEDYCQLSHVMVSQGGSVHSEVDDVLARHGKKRRVTVTVPNYNQVALVLADTDCVATLPSRLLHRYASGLDLLPLPFSMRPFDLVMGWHVRAQHDPAHQWLRERFVRAATSSV
ncbi:LysR family transcriptional regulator [Cystobacter ferrugineus]|uniref:LysR family transcriptional regulator n=1 Tax=Cystobacter ferrugineus TaxID=83449 RepID=A0A1L9BEG8_9BACT|nr:LysR family transcriptional regulator [Cystobacter ferrugineus]OJH40625.1 LysR family transcriptional regulator [Cystobacter ferrugineus]